MQKVLAFGASSLVVLSYPLFLYAQVTTGIVPCGGVECTCAHLAQLANNVLTWMLYVMVFISAGTFSYAGLRYLTAGMAGDPGQVQRASKMLKNVTKGLVLALMAWFIVDTTIRTLGNSQLYALWSKIC